MAPVKSRPKAQNGRTRGDDDSNMRVADAPASGPSATRPAEQSRFCLLWPMKIWRARNTFMARCRVGPVARPFGVWPFMHRCYLPLLQRGSYCARERPAYLTLGSPAFGAECTKQRTSPAASGAHMSTSTRDCPVLTALSLRVRPQPKAVGCAGKPGNGRGGSRGGSQNGRSELQGRDRGRLPTVPTALQNPKLAAVLLRRQWHGAEVK